MRQAQGARDASGGNPKAPVRPRPTPQPDPAASAPQPDPAALPDPAAAAEARLQRPLGQTRALAEMLVHDHAFFRLVHLNLHPVGSHGRAWRSAQPFPYQLRQAAARGIRTVINLRGARHDGGYALERAACQRHGLALEDFQLRSRGAPSPDDILKAAALLQRVAYPVLFHCKSGADRAGLMAALYLILQEQVPVAQARQQLHWRYLHVRQSATGILDYFFECYLHDTAAAPQPFLEWVTTRYAHDGFKARFRQARRQAGWAAWLNDRLLKRE